MKSERTSNPLTSFAEASPASPSALPASGKRRKTRGGSGPSSSESFASYDPSTSSWRTSQASFLQAEDQPLVKFSGTWPRAGMIVNGTAFRLPPSAPRTSVTESSLWPTPVSQEGGEGQDPSARGRKLHKLVQRWPTPVQGDAHLSSKPEAAERRLAEGKATLSRVVQRWPTPRGGHAGVGLVGRTGHWEMPQAKADSSEEAHQMGAGNGGQLNPTWVEWLMGFPLGWTDLDASETL